MNNNFDSEFFINFEAWITSQMDEVDIQRIEQRKREEKRTRKYIELKPDMQMFANLVYLQIMSN